MSAPAIEARLCVRYAETDAMGYVYHGNYFVWFEVGRSEFYRAMVGDDPGSFFRVYGMPAVEASARYHAPCRYDDPIVVITRLEELRSRTVSFAYEVRRDTDGALLATGRTVHVCVDGGGKPCRIPEGVRLALAAGRAESV